MRKIGLLPGAALAAAMGVLLGSGILVWLSFRGISPRASLAPSELALLVTADAFVPYGVVPRQGVHRETTAAKRNADGSLELEYRYQDAKEGIRIMAEAEICRHDRQARHSFAGRVLAYRLGARFGSIEPGATLHVDDGVLALGDQRFFAVLRRSGVPVGNVVVVRQGHTVHSLILVGAYLDNTADLHALFEPVLAHGGMASTEQSHANGGLSAAGN
mgnify:CR=1 FL=1